MNLRGANYRRAMDAVTPALTARANALIQEAGGRFTPRMIATLAKEFSLPTKTTCEFLEHAEVLPSGTWERLSEGTKKAVRELAKVTQ